jgi:hypothetical protein
MTLNDLKHIGKSTGQVTKYQVLGFQVDAIKHSEKSRCQLETLLYLEMIELGSKRDG